MSGEDARPSRDAVEFMLVALEVADQWFDDRETAKLAATTIGRDELAAGFVSLFRTLRRNLAEVHGLTDADITVAIRRQALVDLGLDPGALPAGGDPS